MTTDLARHITLEKYGQVALLICLMSLALAACTSTSRNASVPTAIPVSPAAPTAAREAQVQSVEVQILNTDPPQVNAVVRGNLTESCATLGESQVQYASNTFQIKILAVSPTDRGCVQVSTPFTTAIALNTQRLPAGAYTVIANGVRAVFTWPVAVAMPNTVTPIATPTAAPIAAPTAAPTIVACVDKPTFVADVTVPDNTVIAPSAAFIKTWRVRNDGTCAWGPGQTLRALTFTKGVQMGAPAQISLAQKVAPGGTVDVSINMTAPSTPGTYRSEWKFLKTDGQLVGVGANRQTPLYAQIIVSSPQSGPGRTKTYVSKAYHYQIDYPADWVVLVNTFVSTGAGTNPEYVTLAPSANGLPRVEIDALTNAPPMQGYENCEKNFTFHDLLACMISLPGGQYPPAKLWIVQRGATYLFIYMSYQGAEPVQLFTDFVSSFRFLP